MFVSYDDLIIDWRTHWSNDCYSFLFGMSFGLILCIFKRLGLVDEYETNLENDSADAKDKRREQKNLPPYLKLFLIFISFVGFCGYFLFAILCRSKENCDSVTTYITVIPVSENFIFIFRQNVYTRPLIDYKMRIVF